MQISPINNSQSFGMSAQVPIDIIKKAGQAGGDSTLRLNALIDFFNNREDVDFVVSKAQNGNLFSSKVVAQLFGEIVGNRTVILKEVDFIKCPTDALRKMGLKSTADKIDDIYQNVLLSIAKNSKGMNSDFPNNRSRVEYVDRIAEILPSNNKQELTGNVQNFSSNNIQERISNIQRPSNAKRLDAGKSLQTAPSRSKFN